MTGDEDLFSMVFRTLIVLFSYGYNIETCKIIEATFLTLHCLPYARFFAGQRGAWPNGKYATEGYGAPGQKGGRGWKAAEGGGWGGVLCSFKLFTARRVCIARICHGMMSVCLSVGHTPVLCLNGYIYPQFFSPSVSPTILVFPYQTGWRYSDGNPPNGGVECKRYAKMTIFFTNISLYLRNGYN